MSDETDRAVTVGRTNPRSAGGMYVHELSACPFVPTAELNCLFRSHDPRMPVAPTLTKATTKFYTSALVVTVVLLSKHAFILSRSKKTITEHTPFTFLFFSFHAFISIRVLFDFAFARARSSHSVKNGQAKHEAMMIATLSFFFFLKTIKF